MASLVEYYRGTVFGLCYRMLGHRQDAEDVTQESFVRVFRSLSRWDNQRDFKPWLLAIAGNRCRSMLAIRGRRPASRDVMHDLPDPNENGDAAALLNEEVVLALTELREEHRQAFLLFHEQELSYAEIGVALKRPVGTIKTWIHRARRELVRLLRERGVIEGKQHEPMRNVRGTA